VARLLADRVWFDGTYAAAACKKWILNASLAEILSVALLVLGLACAVIRPFG
jgi:hypothetical protein